MVKLPTPMRVLSAVERQTRGAVANARIATEAVAAAAAQRLALTDAVGSADEPPGPGTLARLSPDTCRQLLATRSVGRLAYLARAGTPVIVPVNYAFDGRDLVIRTGPGPKLQAAERRERVAFEVDDIDEDTHTGWSVVLSGSARRLSSVEERRLPAGSQPGPWATGARSALLMITPTRIDGRRLG